MTRSDPRTEHGFSLIELMVAVAILGIITAQLFVVFSNQKRTFSSNQRALESQERARVSLDLISFDSRMAGFMVPQQLGVSSVDGGTDDPDRFCLSDAGYFNFPSAPAWTSAELDPRLNTFPGSTVTNLGDSTVELNTLDIDGDGDTSEFRAPTAGATNGGGIIIASSTETFCARITAIAGNTITFDANDATSYVGGALRAVPANVYELNSDLDLLRNGTVLSTGIEDLQVEFWLDNAGTPNGELDGDTEFPVNDLINPDPPSGSITADNGLIRRLRVTVVSVTDRDEDLKSASGSLIGNRPAVANRIAGTTDDRFRRRSYSVSILPRNLVTVGDS